MEQKIMADSAFDTLKGLNDIPFELVALFADM
jgi:hypothetical protein